MADWAPNISRGESDEKVFSTAGSSATWTVKGYWKADVFGNVSAGTGTITIKSATSGATAVKVADLDFSGSVTDLWFTEIQLRPDDEIVLTLGAGTTGSVGIRIYWPAA